jgi:hypothetical protein
VNARLVSHSTRGQLLIPRQHSQPCSTKKKSVDHPKLETIHIICRARRSDDALGKSRRQRTSSTDLLDRLYVTFPVFSCHVLTHRHLSTKSEADRHQPERRKDRLYSLVWSSSRRLLQNPNPSSLLRHPRARVDARGTTMATKVTRVMMVGPLIRYLGKTDHQLSANGETTGVSLGQCSHRHDFQNLNICIIIQSLVYVQTAPKITCIHNHPLPGTFGSLLTSSEGRERCPMSPSSISPYPSSLG